MDAFSTRLESSVDRVHPAPRAEPVALRDLLTRATAPGGVTPEQILEEEALRKIEKHVRASPRRAIGEPDSVHDADFELARACYALCRFVRPANVVETGVANGVTTAFLLQALEANGAGALFSIDLPPRGVEPKLVGHLVPPQIRPRWRLSFGASKQLLPSLLENLERIEMFVHDSRHTYRNVCRELQTVSKHLSRPAAVVVDDAERNSAFFDWTAETRPDVSGVLRSRGKRSLIGAAVFLRQDD